MLFYSALAILLCGTQFSVLSINIALHAQVKPSPSQIVGSVITTDGLKAALERRLDVESVSVFYPASYHDYLNTEWDLLLIEGWFPSIVEFIQLTRNRFHDIKIVYFCLDPTYPSYDDLVSFDFDGILTNSRSLLDKLTISNKELMLLAADERQMAPNASIAREFGAVYVGAGGPMLKHKPALHKALLSSIPHSLRLHGFHWETVEGLSQVWRGALPRDELASAYASAHTVLASTIASQSDSGMINNRIFEALSCGSVILSDYSPALEEMFTHRKDPFHGHPLPDLVLFYNETQPADQLIDKVIRNSRYYDEVRRQAREFIVQGHTWSHRAVQLLNFYDRLKSAEATTGACAAIVQSNTVGGVETSRLCPANNRCDRYQCPRMLWVVSESLSHHSDYLHHLSVFRSSYVCRQYDVITVSEAVWEQHVQQWNDDVTCNAPEGSSSSTVGVSGGGVEEGSCPVRDFLSQFDVLLIHAVPFDSVDVGISYLPSSIRVRGKQRMQKRALMMMGFDSTALVRMCQEALQLVENASELRSVFTTHFVDHYDLVMYRSHFELSLLREAIGCQFDDMRLQHVFGVGLVGSSDPADAARFKAPHDVVVCFYSQRHLCSSPMREHQLVAASRTSPRRVLTLLLGGDWDEWLAFGGVVLAGEEAEGVIHVKGGEYSRLAVSLVRTAGHVYLMQEKNDFSSSSVFNSDQFWSQCVTSPVEACLLNTTSDILWPFVAAAVSEYNVSIHLLNSISGLFDLVERDLTGWSEQTALQSLHWAFNRLHGFGSRLSAVDGKVISLVSEKSGGGVVCTNCNGNDRSESYLLQPGLLDHWQDQRVVDDVSKTPRILQKILLKMTYTDFEVGRDGECCLQQVLSQPSDNVLCLQRSFEFVELLVLSNSTTIKLGQIPSTIPLKIYLRGTFYADSFYLTSVDVPVQVDNSILMGKRSLIQSDSNGPLQNRVYSYSLYI